MSSLKNRIFERHLMTRDELADLDEQFGACDTNGDHRIDFGEFSRLLDRLGSKAPAGHRRSHFDDIDLNKDGMIDRREFTKWWRAA